MRASYLYAIAALGTAFASPIKLITRDVPHEEQEKKYVILVAPRGDMLGHGGVSNIPRAIPNELFERVPPKDPEIIRPTTDQPPPGEPTKVPPQAPADAPQSNGGALKFGGIGAAVGYLLGGGSLKVRG